MSNKVKGIRITCNCGKKINLQYISINFQYIGCDNKNNPLFKCKDCGIVVWG